MLLELRRSLKSTLIRWRCQLFMLQLVVLPRIKMSCVILLRLSSVFTNSLQLFSVITLMAFGPVLALLMDWESVNVNRKWWGQTESTLATQTCQRFERNEILNRKERGYGMERSEISWLCFYESCCLPTFTYSFASFGFDTRQKSWPHSPFDGTISFVDFFSTHFRIITRTDWNSGLCNRNGAWRPLRAG